MAAAIALVSVELTSSEKSSQTSSNQVLRSRLRDTLKRSVSIFPRRNAAGKLSSMPCAPRPMILTR